MNHDYRFARERMVKNQLISRGIRDKRVLEVMGRVPRHLFVEEALELEAYNDHPLPIGHRQTISQPYIVALMVETLDLKGGEKILEIGTGSGYQTAILASLARTVLTVERIRPLMENAKRVLESQGHTNILFRTQDGTLGWKDFEPYDGILVAAGAPEIPKPLLNQLSEGGRMVIPVGDRSCQSLIKVTRVQNTFKKEDLGSCRFVDLVGAHGWKQD